MYILNVKEEKIMMKLWDHGECDVGTIKKIIDIPYTTIASILHKLELNGFCNKKKCNCSIKYIYSVYISKEEYRDYVLNHIISNYFDSIESACTYLGSNRY